MTDSDSGQAHPAERKRSWRRKPVVILALVLVVGGAYAALWPITQARREPARRATCLSNIRSNVIALLTYARDHGSRLPTLAHGQRDSWAIEAVGWINHPDVLWCPRDERYRQYIRTRRRETERELDISETILLRRKRIGRASSYLMNRELSGIWLGDVENPAETVLLEEAGEFHKGYCVVAYLDGHAEAVKVGGE